MALDAVLVCVPNHLHAPAVLAADKHILSEKPLCITLEEADRIVEAVRRSGVTYMAGHNQLFMPAAREARRLLEAGAIGAVRWIRSVGFLPGGGRGDFFKGTWRADLRCQGGGELIDGGFHPTYRLL
ncbi:MAG: Gfo/Idh/MocA family oxidoreductase [Candidatus Sumerlaeota bacterium]|nr:Gfo/Idh/MocA family oxidoreductase [Candidatus Sumerlaeota bacterium]